MSNITWAAAGRFIIGTMGTPYRARPHTAIEVLWMLAMREARS